MSVETGHREVSHSRVLSWLWAQTGVLARSFWWCLFLWSCFCSEGRFVCSPYLSKLKKPVPPFSWGLPKHTGKPAFCHLPQILLTLHCVLMWSGGRARKGIKTQVKSSLPTWRRIRARNIARLVGHLVYVYETLSLTPQYMQTGYNGKLKALRRWKLEVRSSKTS